MTLRIVQWTTGNVGRQSVIAIARNPGLELVGCYAWSPDKVGRDIGELCGLDPLGVTATDDVDALLALRPDCVVYNPMWPSIDELVRILDSRCQRRHHGGVHQRPAARSGSRAIGRGVRARRLVALRHGDQSGVGRAAEHRARRHLRSDRQGHDQRGGLHGRLRLACHGEAGGVRSADRRPQPPGDDGRGHGGVQRSRGDGGRRARRRARRRGVHPSTPRRRRTSISARGRSRRDAWPGSPPAGRAGWATGPWSS